MHVASWNQKIEDRGSVATLDILERVNRDASYSTVPGSMSKQVILKGRSFRQR